MPTALINQLHEVGTSCAPLAAWCRCGGGRKDLCEKCILGGPDVCDAKVIKALVGKVIEARTGEDAWEQHAAYWKGVADRATSLGMNLDRIREF